MNIQKGAEKSYDKCHSGEDVFDLITHWITPIESFHVHLKDEKKGIVLSGNYSRILCGDGKDARWFYMDIRPDNKGAYSFLDFIMLSEEEVAFLEQRYAANQLRKQ